MFAVAKDHYSTLFRHSLFLNWTRACQDITAILSIGSEPEAAPLPDDFTLEKAIAVMEDLMEGMSIALEECSAIVRAQLGNDLRTKEASAAINQLYVQRYPLVEGAVHKKHKCNKSTIEVMARDGGGGWLDDGRCLLCDDDCGGAVQGAFEGSGRLMDFPPLLFSSSLILIIVALLKKRASEISGAPCFISLLSFLLLCRLP